MLKMCRVSCSKDGKEEKQEEGINMENSLAIVGEFFTTVVMKEYYIVYYTTVNINR